jgi:superfamily II DNA or RNA helicase
LQVLRRLVVSKKEVLSRDERQDEGIAKWKLHKGRATCLYPTGFGKTRVALKTIARLREQKPEAKIIVVVPSDYLKIQWTKELKEFKLEKVEVVIVHTAIRNEYECDLLVVDEVHMMVADTFSNVFRTIRYKLLLCLTGTLDRLDGKQVLLNKYAPVCDTITLQEAIDSNWVADFKQYKVLIDVDLTEYNQYNSAFLHHFAFFSHDFNLAMACVKDNNVKQAYARTLNCSFQEVMGHSVNWIKNMKARMEFVYNHPKKIEIANKILQAREEQKVVTFTKAVEHAKQLCCGEIYHGKMAKGKKEKVMKAFNEASKGILNSCQALNVGADVQGVNTVIIISGDSSSITKRQRIGRGIRKEGEKVAEVWQLVIKNTAEESWYRKSSKDLKTHTVDERQLAELLKNGSYSQTEVEKLLFKF